VPQDEDAVEPGTLTAGALSFLPVHRVARPIYPGELLVASDFLPQDTALDLGAQLESGLLHSPQDS
jgi:hypothetical protein